MAVVTFSISQLVIFCMSQRDIYILTYLLDFYLKNYELSKLDMDNGNNS